MSRPRPAAVLLLSFVTVWGGCAAVTTGRGPEVFPLGGDDQARARSIAARARLAEVIYLGEQHDNPHHHVRQREILEAMVASGMRPTVAFEMLESKEQKVLERALAEARTPAELEARLRWRERGWPDFAMYWPLFDLVATEHLPVVAADLDRMVSRRIARDGLASLRDSEPDLRSRLAPNVEREAAIARTISEAHCGVLPGERLPRMVEAWHARNVAMARGLVEALDRGGPVVVIVGRGHQEPGGLPAQLEALRSGTRQLIVDLVEVPAGERPERVAAGSPGDIVWLTPPAARPDPCAPLRRTPQLLR